MFFAAAAVAGFSPSANARIALPAGSTAEISIVNVDQAAVFHKQRQELVVQLTVSFTQNSETLDRFAVIIPVPSQPTSVTLEESGLMGELKAFDRRTFVRREQHAVILGDCMHEAIVRKPSDPPPSQLLNEWLASHGFSTVDPEDFQYYDENNWHFVVLRIYPKSKSETAVLKPLRISFATKRIVFPIRRFIEDGPDASLFLITKNNLDITPLEELGFDLQMYGGRTQRLRLKSLPESAELLVEELGDSHEVFKEFRRGHIHFFSATASGPLDVPDEIITLPGPYYTPIGVMQNVLACLAAVAIVILMNRQRSKSDDD